MSIISVENLVKKFGNLTAVDTISFGVEEGTIFGFLGPNGAGKTTTINILCTLLSPTSGKAFIAGHDCLNDPSEVRKAIGIVFQDYKLVKEWTIEKNVMLPLIIGGYEKSVSEQQVHKLLNHVKLNHQSEKYPLELSGGEQQRVAMARALSHNPILILADEPTGNLDEYSSELIWNLLEGANTQLKTTIIVVTHHIPETMKIDYKHLHIEYGTIYEVT